ncbi:MAG TPA: endonuclease/exonuclease/phosphatase family protein [Polyangiaceae bacterium]|nr:endonuclease/exonuclease/phosphatase family protein [Polyangiaceae bacterium]
MLAAVLCDRLDALTRPEPSPLYEERPANPAPALRRLRVMTYNTHGGIGADGQCRPERIAQVIGRYSPDVVALQEIDVGCGGSGRLDQARNIADLTGMSAHFTGARDKDGGRYGNAILTHHPYELQAEGILPVRRGEVRAAQCLRLAFDHGHLDVINTHLSLHFFERLAQYRALFSDDPRAPLGQQPAPFPALQGALNRTILCGDFNAGALSPLYFSLRRRLTDAQRARGQRARATWPAHFPLLRLDHIWVGKDLHVENVIVPRDAATRAASDHLPIVVDLRIDGAPMALATQGQTP